MVYLVLPVLPVPSSPHRYVLLPLVVIWTFTFRPLSPHAKEKKENELTTSKRRERTKESFSQRQPWEKGNSKFFSIGSKKKPPSCFLWHHNGTFQNQNLRFFSWRYPEILSTLLPSFFPLLVLRTWVIEP